MQIVVPSWIRVVRQTRRLFWVLFPLLVYAVGCSTQTLLFASTDSRVSTYRQPSHLVLFTANDQPRLAISCRRTGSLYIYDPNNHELVLERSLGTSITKVVAIQNEFLVAILPQDNKVEVLSVAEDRYHSVMSIPTSTYPTEAFWDAESGTLFVSCLWSKRVDAIKLSLNHKVIQSKQTLDLPLWPGSLLRVHDHLLIVDAFGADSCVIDLKSKSIEQHRDIFGSSVQSLVNVPGKSDEVAVIHSVLNEYARTNRSEIQFGVLLTNDLRKIKTDRILDPNEKNVYRDGTFHPIGIPGNGAAEPTGLAIHPDTGRIAVPIGGTDQVALGHVDAKSFQYIPVGRYPTAVAWSEKGDELYVVNQFDDSYSVIDAITRKVVKTVELGPLRKLTDAELGEQLFHSATLSHDSWLTCASCHTDGHTNGQLADNLGDLNFGAPKRTPSLRGVKDTAPYTWLGHAQTLASQTTSSVNKTMNSYRRLDDDEVQFMVAYMESLEPVIPLAEARGNADKAQIERGRLLFVSHNCNSCHAADKYTSFGVYDVGLIDENKAKLFNPPSLKGVSQKGQMLFHDNRAKGIRGVLQDYQHQLENPLSEPQLLDLIAFLESI